MWTKKKKNKQTNKQRRENEITRKKFFVKLMNEIYGIMNKNLIEKQRERERKKRY